jgi:hypothetical protein
MDGPYVGVRKVGWDECWHAILIRQDPFKINYDRVSEDEAQEIMTKLFDGDGEPVHFVPLPRQRQHAGRAHG